MKNGATPGTDFPELFSTLEREIARVFVGQRELVRGVLVALFAGGHVLLEGLPGLGKTLLVRALGGALDLEFARVQCTPDLMPADVIGTHVLLEDGHLGRNLRFQRGPLFAHLVLVDEINRATPKTQSAFLEAMQEQRVTAMGETFVLDPPFVLLATQNPIELEGTYPLPEAQLDRFFFKLQLAFPDADELSRIVDLTTGEQVPEVARVCSREQVLEMTAQARQVKLAERVKRYAVRLVLASHPGSELAPPAVESFVRSGASPRAAQTMILAAKVLALADGRLNVGFDDIRWAALPALRHRLLLGFDAELEGVTGDQVARSLLDTVEPDRP